MSGQESTRRKDKFYTLLVILAALIVTFLLVGYFYTGQPTALFKAFGVIAPVK